MTEISIVVPIFKSAQSLIELTNVIIENVSSITSAYEVIYVDDGSPDDSWKIIESLALQNSSIKGIKLSKNFGQHPAIFAGLANTKGDWVIVMDADFQDNPKYFQNLFGEAQKGFDVVFARRKVRRDSIGKIFSGILFYKVFSYLTDSKFDGTIGNFGIYKRRVINAVLETGEPFRVFSLMVRWVGFGQSSIDVLHGERRNGKSSYTLSKLYNLATMIILTYSQKPLMLAVRYGLIIAFAAFIFVVYNLITQVRLTEYSLLLASIWMVGGLVIFFIGILGLYIGKVLEGVKNRPFYILSEKINFK